MKRYRLSRRLLLASAVFILINAVPAGAQPKKEPVQEVKTAPDSSDLITITGVLSVKGSEPHTFLGLTAEDGTLYRLLGGLAKQLQAHDQNKTVTLKGRITKKAVGPGFPAVFEVTEISEEPPEIL